MCTLFFTRVWISFQRVCTWKNIECSKIIKYCQLFINLSEDFVDLPTGFQINTARNNSHYFCDAWASVLSQTFLIRLILSVNASLITMEQSTQTHTPYTKTPSYTYCTVHLLSMTIRTQTGVNVKCLRFQIQSHVWGQRTHGKCHSLFLSTSFLWL